MYDLARIPTTLQLRTLEAEWIKSCHKSWGVVLMEAAGLGAASLAVELLKEIGGSVAVVCGTGNNGGDGLVIARHLHRRQIQVSVHMLRSDKPLAKEGESAVNKRIFEDNVALPIHYFDEDSLEFLERSIDESALVIDALLGTGLTRDVTGAYADAIEIINSSGKPVLSVDLPSGIHSDTGQVMGVAVEADVTATFGYLKAGLLHYPGAQHAGVVSLVDIGLPSLNNLPSTLAAVSSTLETPKWWLATYAQVKDWLPARPAHGHKGTFGRVLAVAGSRLMTGSCMLAARSVLRSGAGYVVLATARSVTQHLPPEEIVYFALSETTDGTIAAIAAEELTAQIEEADALLLGPGLGDGAQELMERLLQGISKPCLIDADGLNALAKLKDIKLTCPENFVLTPHPKELERLLDIPVSAIEADRTAAAAKAVERFGCNVVLKGAHTVVATPNEGIYIIPTGNSGMATPGSGDVLSGIIAALLSRGMHPSYAAAAGAYIHGAAGDLSAGKLGQDGMVAHDIVGCIPLVLAELRDGEFICRQIESEVIG